MQPGTSGSSGKYVSLCVSVTRVKASATLGDAATWTVSAWTTLGNVPDATIRLKATKGSGTPVFSFGCGSHDGTASCDLGAVDAKSAPRQLQAQLTVPATATDITSAKLTAIGSAAKLPHDPQASVAVTITAPTTPAVVTDPLPVGNLPGIPAADPSLSPGGSAATLFPKLNPSAPAAPAVPGAAGTGTKAAARTQPLANTRALPQGSSVVGAQLLGLAALALAFVLAVTRLSIRRRTAPAKAAPAGSAGDGGAGGTAAGKGAGTAGVVDGAGAAAAADGTGGVAVLDDAEPATASEDAETATAGEDAEATAEAEDADAKAEAEDADADADAEDAETTAAVSENTTAATANEDAATATTDTEPTDTKTADED